MSNEVDITESLGQAAQDLEDSLNDIDAEEIIYTLRDSPIYRLTNIQLLIVHSYMTLLYNNLLDKGFNSTTATEAELAAYNYEILKRMEVTATAVEEE